MTPINVFQKNWAFTSSESKQPEIKTSTFGPCYIVTFTSGKFAAMAHIDDMTQVESMKLIFNRFIQNSVDLKEIKAVVLGGWKEHKESFIWGHKILEQIKNAGIENVNTKYMFSKKTLSAAQHASGISMSESASYYHKGVLVDSRNGKTFLMKELDTELERKQVEQNKLFLEQYGRIMEESDIEVALTEETQGVL